MTAAPEAAGERVPPPQLRKLCMALPNVEERSSSGEPAWFAGKRMFLTLADHHHDDRVAFWAAAPRTPHRSRRRLRTLWPHSGSPAV